MTITKVSYGRTYSLGNYNSERIDLEASVTDSEHIEDVVKELKEMCDTYHKTNNPHLYQEQEARYTNAFSQNLDEPLSEPPFLQHIENQPPKKLSQQELILQEIQNCQSENQLKSLQLIANQNDITKEAYNNKLKELTK